MIDRAEELVDKIEDESALNILKEDAEIYMKADNTTGDKLTPEEWKKIQLNGMNSDNSWEASARKYVQL